MIVASSKTCISEKVHIGKFFAQPNGYYYPFGKEARGSSTSNEPKEQFTGKERDAETGLDYFGARYYNSEIGRWMSVDPLSGKYPSWAPYAYVYNNPLRFVDPTGMEVEQTGDGGDEKKKENVKVQVGYVPVAAGTNHTLLIITDESTGQVIQMEGMPTSRESGGSTAVAKMAMNDPTALISSENWGNLEKNNATDIGSLSESDKETVATPEGMTGTEFKEALAKAYDSYQSGSVPYAPLPVGENGNSNALIGSIIREAGSKFEPSKMSPGWGQNVLPSQRSKK